MPVSPIDPSTPYPYSAEEGNPRIDVTMLLLSLELTVKRQELSLQRGDIANIYDKGAVSLKIATRGFSRQLEATPSTYASLLSSGGQIEQTNSSIFGSLANTGPGTDAMQITDSTGFTYSVRKKSKSAGVTPVPSVSTNDNGHSPDPDADENLM